ncbi:hypothetical protein DYH09_31380 [bacterium CPR1]|nr:hypothetical protein [bacterium CPR1]
MRELKSVLDHLVVPLHRFVQRRAAQVRASDKSPGLSVALKEEVGLGVESLVFRLKHPQVDLAWKSGFEVQQSK